jgi:hypothetical protein
VRSAPRLPAGRVKMTEEVSIAMPLLAMERHALPALAREDFRVGGLDHSDARTAIGADDAPPVGSFANRSLPNIEPVSATLKRKLKNGAQRPAPEPAPQGPKQQKLLTRDWDMPVTGHLLREIVVRHGIRVAVIGRDTGTPARCRNILGAAGFVETKVVVEPTSTFFSADQLEGALELAVTIPLYGITPSDAIRIKGLRDEYVAETRSSSVQQAIDAELGAYFVLAYWSRTCASAENRKPRKTNRVSTGSCINPPPVMVHIPPPPMPETGYVTVFCRGPCYSFMAPKTFHLKRFGG